MPPVAPLIVTGTLQIYKGSAAQGSPIPAHMEPPSTEQIAADGGAVFWEMETAPNTAIRENWFIKVVTCPSNPGLVTTSAMGWNVSAVRQSGGLIPKTLFRAQQKVQS